MNNLKKIHDLGQSIWLDFFNREIMDNGALQKLMDEDRLSGITSNPSIFESAVASSPDYDEDIRKYAKGQKSNEEIFFEFAIKDHNLNQKQTRTNQTGKQYKSDKNME